MQLVQLNTRLSVSLVPSELPGIGRECTFGDKNRYYASDRVRQFVPTS